MLIQQDKPNQRTEKGDLQNHLNVDSIKSHDSGCIKASDLPKDFRTAAVGPGVTGRGLVYSVS